MDKPETQMERDERLVQYDGSDRIITSHELKKIQAQTPDTWRIDCGMNRLDILTEGLFGEGEVITVSGYSGHGKTLLTQSFTHNLAEQNEYPGWFSFEVGPKLFLKQFGDDLPFFTLPAALVDTNLDWILERMEESILKYRTKIFFIDHLHYIVPFTTNMSIVIGFVMRKLKLFVNKHGICVVLIAHTGKTVADKEPDEGDVRDSSFVIQESATVLMVWRSKDNLGEYGDLGVVKVCKARESGAKGKKVHLLKKGKYLEEDMIRNA
jgi:replicative DNA helicase